MGNHEPGRVMVDGVMISYDYKDANLGANKCFRYLKVFLVLYLYLFIFYIYIFGCI